MNDKVDAPEIKLIPFLIFGINNVKILAKLSNGNSFKLGTVFKVLAITTKAFTVIFPILAANADPPPNNFIPLTIPGT